MKTPEAVRAIGYTPSIGNFLTMTLLSFCAIMLLPRQFHVSVVENSTDAEVSRARWLFPLYLVAINLFVIPIAIAGLVTFPFGAVDSDMYVLALPIEGNSPLLSVGVFVGGLSAATAMVIVECVALSIMVSNDIVLPLVLQRSSRRSRAGQQDFGDFLLKVRRFAIFAIMVMAYFYYRALGNAQLAAIGLLSFAAIAQLAPAFFGGLFWRRAPRAAPWAACWSASRCGSTRCSCRASSRRSTAGLQCCCSTARSASRRCGRRRCSAPTCRR